MFFYLQNMLHIVIVFCRKLIMCMFQGWSSESESLLASSQHGGGIYLCLWKVSKDIQIERFLRETRESACTEKAAYVFGLRVRVRRSQRIRRPHGVGT